MKRSKSVDYPTSNPNKVLILGMATIVLAGFGTYYLNRPEKFEEGTVITKFECHRTYTTDVCDKPLENNQPSPASSSGGGGSNNYNHIFIVTNTRGYVVGSYPVTYTGSGFSAITPNGNIALGTGTGGVRLSPEGTSKVTPNIRPTSSHIRTTPVAPAAGGNTAMRAPAASVPSVGGTSVSRGGFGAVGTAVGSAAAS